MKKPKVSNKDLIGTSINGVKIIGYFVRHEDRNGKLVSRGCFECQCECGNTFTGRCDIIRRGEQTHCGCLPRGSTVCKDCSRPKASGEPCRVCQLDYQKAYQKKKKRAKGGLYINANYGIIAGETYIKHICKVCDKEFIPNKRSNEVCRECRAIVNKVRHISGLDKRGKGISLVVLDRDKAIELARIVYRTVKCDYCGEPFNKDIKEERRSIDHIIPVCRNGSNDLDNFAVCHWKCNSLKGKLLPDELMLLCELIAKNMKRKSRKKKAA